jgi:PleD family two-component response regulator
VRAANDLDQAYRVRSASGAEEAIALVQDAESREIPPALIIVEADIPDIEAVSALRQLRTAEATCLIPVLRIGNAPPNSAFNSSVHLNGPDATAGILTYWLTVNLGP